MGLYFLVNVGKYSRYLIFAENNGKDVIETPPGKRKRIIDGLRLIQYIKNGISKNDQFVRQ